MHVQSFRELRLQDPSKPTEYAEAILQIRQRHKRLPPLFAEAVKRIRCISEGAEEEPTQLEAWAETFLRSRVSSELLMSGPRKVRVSIVIFWILDVLETF